LQIVAEIDYELA